MIMAIMARIITVTTNHPIKSKSKMSTKSYEQWMMTLKVLIGWEWWQSLDSVSIKAPLVVT